MKENNKKLKKELNEEEINKIENRLFIINKYNEMKNINENDIEKDKEIIREELFNNKKEIKNEEYIIKLIK